MSSKAAMAVRGMAAGGLATLCMSAVMLLSKNLGIHDELPPRRITKEVLKSTGAAAHARGEKLTVMTAAAHMAFGMGSGAAFALARRQSPRVLPGVAYAMSIWFLSYRGIAPALGLMPKTKHDQSGRVWTNVAAHLVFGAVLGASLEQLEYRS